MSKEDQIIEMIGEVAVQATVQVLESEARLGGRIDNVENRLISVEDRLVSVEDRLVSVENKLVSVESRVISTEKQVISLDHKVDRVEKSLREEMREIRNENATFHDEIIGYLRRAEQEHDFTSAHLNRHDEQIVELQVAVGIA